MRILDNNITGFRNYNIVISFMFACKKLYDTNLN